MKLVQLEYFCAVCRYHSITRAAEELYVTQPTISVAIRELEKELKTRLFHHEKNRISLTREGEAFYRRADAVLRETRAMVTEFSSLGETEKPIRIGIPPIISTLFFPARRKVRRLSVFEAAGQSQGLCPDPHPSRDYQQIRRDLEEGGLHPGPHHEIH